MLAFTEVCGLLGKTYAPILPPWGTGLALAPLRRLGLRVPPEMLGQLRFGRGLDNRKLKATGFEYRHTSRETVLRFGEHLRLHPVVRGVREPYRYEREVEEFLRWSPSVRRGAEGLEPLSPHQFTELERLLRAYADRAGVEEPPVPEPRPPVPEPEPPEPEPVAAEPEPPPGPPVAEYDDLEAEEILSLLSSLDAPDLDAILGYERAHRARPTVVRALEGLLARQRAGAPR